MILSPNMKALKNKLLNRWLIVVLPILFIGAILVLVDNFYFKEQPFYNIMSPLVFLSALWVGFVYLFLAAKPKVIARFLIENTRGDYYSNKHKAIKIFWNLLRKIKVLEFFIDLFLFVLALAAFVLIIYLMNKLGFVISLVEIWFEAPELIFGVIAIPLALLLGYLLYLVVPSFKGIRHTKAKQVKDLLKQLVLVSGFKKKIKILIFKNKLPVVFTKVKFNRDITIHISDSILDLLSKRELEAVLAHELAHCKADFYWDFIYLKVLFRLIKIESWLLFFLLLLYINPYLVAGWIVVSVISILFFFSEDTQASLADLRRYSRIIYLYNPLLVVLDLVFDIIYYYLVYNEDFYADLTAVSYTRYPKSLYDALVKLQGQVEKQTGKIPDEFNHLYFTAENSDQDINIAAQPSIENRLSLLDDLDVKLREKIKKYSTK